MSKTTKSDANMKYADNSEVREMIVTKLVQGIGQARGRAILRKPHMPMECGHLQEHCHKETNDTRK